jgi:hypothetical protein
MQLFLKAGAAERWGHQNIKEVERQPGCCMMLWLFLFRGNISSERSKKALGFLVIATIDNVFQKFQTGCDVF